MNKMLKNIIIMAAVVVVAVAAFIFLPMLEPAEDEETEVVEAEPTADPALLMVSEYSSDDVEKVTLLYEGEETVVLYDADNDLYYIEGHEDVYINQTTASNIFYTAAYVEAEEIVTEDMTNLAEYGLDEPLSQVTAEFSDGTTSVYYFGDQVPGTSQYYMYKEGVDTIYVVWTNYGNNSLNKLDDMVDVEETSLELDTLMLITIFKEGEIYMEFTKYDSDEYLDVSAWKLTEPYFRSVDTDEDGGFYLLTDDLIAFEPDEVYDAEGTGDDYGFDEPYAQVDFVSEEGDQTSIIIGNEIEDGVYAMKYGDSDIVYTVDESDITFFDYETIDVIDRLFMLINISYVEEIEMTGVFGDNTLVVTNTERVDDEGEVSLDTNGDPIMDTNYIVEGVELTEDETEQGSWFYQTILGMEITNEADEDFVEGDVVGEIILTLNASPYEYVIQFYEYNDYFYAVRFEDNETLLIVKKSEADEIPVSYEALVNREMERPY